MSSLKQFKLPDVGEGLTEADILKWHVQPGEDVAVNQIIVEIETAKAVVELPSPYQGVVDQLLVAEGTTADVGTPIISVRVADDDGGAVASGAVASGAVASGAVASGAGAGSEELVSPEAEGQSLLVGYGVRPESSARRSRRPAAGPVPAGPAGLTAGSLHEAIRLGRAHVALAPAQQPAAGGAGSERALAKPPVRKLARDLGIDLTGISGTGPAGSVTRADVEAAAAARAGEREEVPAVPGGPPRIARLSALPREERTPIRGVRKHTAAAVSASAFTAPHVTEFLQIDITATMDAVGRLRALPDFEDIRVTPLLLVARALLVAAARHPMINSSWDEAAQEIVVRHYVNLGIAAATGRGLVVPNVKDAHALTLPELARALAELAETARAGLSTPADLSGGTISITNVGVFGVDTGTPIIASGEAAILAFGQVREAPWVVGGQLAVRQVCTLALSFDHRIVDGDLGSAVLRDVGGMLTDPLRMLAWS